MSIGCWIMVVIATVSLLGVLVGMVGAAMTWWSGHPVDE